MLEGTTRSPAEQHNVYIYILSRAARQTSPALGTIHLTPVLWTPQPFPSKLSPKPGTICSAELMCSEAEQPVVGFWEPEVSPGSM